MAAHPLNLPQLYLHKTDINTVNKESSTAILDNNDRAGKFRQQSYHHLLLKPQNEEKQYNTSQLRILDSWPLNSKYSGQPILLKQMLNALPKWPNKAESMHQQQPQQTSTSLDCRTARQLLQPYRETFNVMIENFTTYAPVLQRIKHAYEQTLMLDEHALQQQMQLQTQLATVQRKAAMQMQQLHLQLESNERAKNDEISTLKELLTESQQREQQITASCQAMRVELEELNTRLDSFSASNRTLSDALQRYQVNGHDLDTLLSQEKAYSRQLFEEKATLEKNYTQLVDELQLLRNELQGSVDSITFKNLDTELKHLRCDHQDLMVQYERKCTEFDDLNNMYNSISIEREKTLAERSNYSQMRQKLTPRPKWKTIFEKKMLPDIQLLDRSTKSLVDALCEQITRLKSDLAEWEERYPIEKLPEVVDPEKATHRSQWLKCRGIDSTVPKFLRMKGRVKNKNISKRETELLIKEVWKTKHANADTNRMSLDDYMYIFLKRKFGIDYSIVEYGYSLIDSLERFSDDPDCDLFLRIINKQCGEEVVKDQADMIEHLQQAIVDLDASMHGRKVKNRVNRKPLFDLLKKHFSTKSQRRLKLLNAALFNDDRSVEIYYPALFKEDREGNQGHFISELRKQHIEEINEYRQQLHHALKEASVDGTILLADVKAAFFMIDPAKNDTEVEWIIRAGIDKHDGDINWQTVVNLRMFEMGIAHRLIKRSGPPPEEWTARFHLEETSDSPDAVISSGFGYSGDEESTPKQHSS